MDLIIMVGLRQTSNAISEKNLVGYFIYYLAYLNNTIVIQIERDMSMLKTHNVKSILINLKNKIK